MGLRHPVYAAADPCVLCAAFEGDRLIGAILCRLEAVVSSSKGSTLPARAVQRAQCVQAHSTRTDSST